MQLRAAVVALVSMCAFALTLAACDSGTGLDQLLPSSPGNGLPSTLVTQQQLDEAMAAQATPLSGASVQAFLAGTTFQSAYSRVWGASQTYVTSLVFQFGTSADASRFLSWERSGITSGNNTFVADHPDVPGSFVFVLDGTSQAGGAAPQFCNGVWFTRNTDTFESIVCGASPEWATQAEALAGSEYALAKQALPA